MIFNLFLTARGNPVHNSVFVNNPGLPTLTPGGAVALQRTLYHLHHCLKEVRGASLTYLIWYLHTNILRTHTHTSLWDSPEESRERVRANARARYIRHTLRKYESHSESERYLLCKRYIMSRKGTQEKEKRNSSNNRGDSQNASCEWSTLLMFVLAEAVKEAELKAAVTYRLLPKTNRQVRTTSSTGEPKIWFAYICCGVAPNTIHAA